MPNIGCESLFKTLLPALRIILYIDDHGKIHIF